MDRIFVSRGGVKLQAAIDKFKINVEEKTILDVGSSTGGFVDCLLQNGAGRVYAVDTAYGELAWKLRNNPKVTVMERTNILTLDGMDQVDLVTIDSGWTKLELVLSKIRFFLKSKGLIIALLKPQYEARQSQLVKGVVPKELAQKIKDEVIGKITSLGFTILDQIESPILGRAGNKEFLLKIEPS